MKTQLVIFDLDGTLLDTLDDLATSVNHALQRYGYPQHELMAYRYFVGNGITKLIERALPEEARQEETVALLRSAFLSHYQTHKTNLSKPYPGIPELLESLHRQNVLLAVASNKYHQGTVELVRHFFGESLFAIVLGQREGIPVKPDPTIIEEILTFSAVSKSETLYVGDSGIDMQAARNSAVTSVGVTWGFRPRQELEQHGANLIVDSPLEIEAWING